MAYDTLTATITALLNVTGTKNATFGDNIAIPFNQKPSTAYTFGNGAKQLQTFYRAARTLSDGANEDLDLAGGLTDDAGATITFTEVKVLYIENTSATETLTVGAAASNALASLFGATTHTLKIPPKTKLLLWSEDATGYAVVASTGDLLRVTNSGGGSTTYNILVAGD